MKSEKAFRTVGIMAIILGVIALTVNQFIMAFVLIVIGIGVIWSAVGTGSFNERNIYHKIIENANISVDELYDLFKDMDTCLGKCFIADYKDEGRSLIWGPSAFEDMIVANSHTGKLELKTSNYTSAVKKDEENEHRFEIVTDMKTLEVDTKSYSWFASYKVMTSVLLDDITNIATKYLAGEEPKVPEELDVFSLFRYSSATNILHDSEDEEILEAYAQRKPVCTVELKSIEDGSELATVVPQNPGAIDITTAVFDIVSDGEKYGTIYHIPTDKIDKYRIETPHGEFEAEAFQAVRKANIGSNYILNKGGERKAVIFGSPRIEFPEIGYIEIDGICSFDNEYIVLYTAFEMFLMNSRRYLR